MRSATVGHAMDVRPVIPFHVVSDEVIEDLHRRALRVLEEIGLRVSDPRLVRRLQGRPGVRFRDDRVLLDPAVVREVVNLTERRKQPLPDRRAPDHISILTAYHARHILDPATDTIRPLTEADAVRAARLTDALRDRDVIGGAPGAPQDIAPPLRIIAQYRISAEWSRSGHYAPVSTVAEQRYIRQMARVLDEDFPLECYLISPLRLEGDEVSAVITYLETCGKSEQPVHVTTLSMPTMGLSGPADPLALFVLGLAESIGGCVAMTLAFEQEARVHMARPGAYPCDFRTGALIVGSPEAVLIELIRRDFDRFYRHGMWARALRTMSPVTGVQAAAEKSAGAVACALAGYEEWFGGGYIGLDEVFSPVQLLVDCEIRDYALQLARGFEADPSFDDVAVLREVLTNTTEGLPFMTHETTVAGFRKVFRPSRLFDRHPYRGQTQPKDEALCAAKEELKRLEGAHEYRLDAARRAEIQRIYEDARTELG